MNQFETITLFKVSARNCEYAAPWFEDYKIARGYMEDLIADGETKDFFVEGREFLKEIEKSVA